MFLYFTRFDAVLTT